MENINVEATPQQWGVLLQLLNVGIKSGAYDLSMAEAIAFWSGKIETTAKQAVEAPAQEAE